MKVIKNNKILSNALILGAGTFLAKILGAIFRIPLTALIGAEGIGIYQLVFPLYTVLLDFSGAGAPTALSRIISSTKKEDRYIEAEYYLKTSLKSLTLIGFIFSLLMATLCVPLAKLQGNENAYLSYITLSPSVILVCLISSYRGYFQGLMNMRPTAFSQILEQVIKLIFGLTFAKILMPNIKLAVAGAVFSITLSEIITFIYLLILYKKFQKKFGLKINFNKSVDNSNAKIRNKNFFKVLIPISIIGICLPFSHLIDSFIIVNILSKNFTNATSLYGLLSGVVCTIINLPVSICYGISIVAVPTISSISCEKNKNKQATKSLILTLIFSLPCALVIGIFPTQIINIIFRSLKGSEIIIASNLLRIASPCVVLLSILQTQNASLIGKGKLYYPVIATSTGIIVKIILNLILLNIPSINIYGGAIALIACYFTADLINFILIYLKAEKNANKIAINRQFAN